MKMNIKKLFVLLSFILCINIYADVKVVEQVEPALKVVEVIKKDLVQITFLKSKVSTIDLKLKDNILLKRYSNYFTYRKISAELEDFEERAKKIKRKRRAK